jgi:ubiquinone/menaquinone biosynthesis C-methylase UbiE
MYTNPRGHYRAFYLTLDKLSLKPDDIFLEIGCGGGVLLNMALESVKYAKAIDHSPDMVQIAKDRNKESLSDGKVEIIQGNAESVLWGDNSFTCAMANQMFFFIDKPTIVLKEFYRVLKPGGRLVITSIGVYNSYVFNGLIGYGYGGQWVMILLNSALGNCLVIISVLIVLVFKKCQEN